MASPLSFQMDEATKARVAWVYNQTADRMDAAPLAFWERHGAETIARLDLPPGARVLDVGCGAGGSALAAAEQVGMTGKVIGVDLAEELLELGRRKAQARNLSNIDFVCSDMTRLDYPPQSFDAVVSVFSLFFVEDMPGLVQEFMRLLKPGGSLAVTTWSPPVFEPLDRLVYEAAARELPHLRRGPTAMDWVSTPEQLEDVMRRGGALGARASAQQSYQSLPRPEDWWTMALGSGLRRIIASLAGDAAARVRERLLNEVVRHNYTQVTTHAIYGIATNVCETTRTFKRQEPSHAPGH